MKTDLFLMKIVVGCSPDSAECEYGGECWATSKHHVEEQQTSSLVENTVWS